MNRINVVFELANTHSLICYSAIYIHYRQSSVQLCPVMYAVINGLITSYWEQYGLYVIYDWGYLLLQSAELCSAFSVMCLLEAVNFVCSSYWQRRWTDCVYSGWDRMSHTVCSRLVSSAFMISQPSLNACAMLCTQNEALLLLTLSVMFCTSMYTCWLQSPNV